VNAPSAICHLPSAPRILIRGVNWLGDAVMTTPALLRLREKFPGSADRAAHAAKLAGLWTKSSGGGRNHFLRTRGKYFCAWAKETARRLARTLAPKI
jgi:hypothetical protein